MSESVSKDVMKKHNKEYLETVCRQMNLNFSGQKIKECLANLV